MKCPSHAAGFRLRICDPSLTALVFSAGKYVLTGGKNRDDIRSACIILRKVVEKYHDVTATAEHGEIIRTRAAARKRAKV
jgi:TATA-box binding protein (TBP) (component of TFIID and TFIIIB)